MLEPVYNIDSREVERTWRYLPEYDRTAAVFNEGYLSVAVPPYPIPYRYLTPRPALQNGQVLAL